METADVRKRVLETLDRTKRVARERRARMDQAGQEFGPLLEQVAVPLCRQVAGALKAAGHPFAVNTPEGAVRLVSERSSDDYVELALDTDGDEPFVVGRTRRGWGRRILESERPVRRCPIRDVTEDELLTFVLEALEPLLAR